MNIKSVNITQQWELEEFIKSAITLTQIFANFITWQGIYVNDFYNWYFESMHPSLNSSIANELLRDLSNFISAYRVVKTDRLMRFCVLVEGDSEFVSLPPIFSALGVLGIDFPNKNSVRFVNLKGKDTIQKEKINANLKKFREDGVSYFVIVDNDPEVERYIADLKRENLIDNKHYLIWENRFEDNFPEEVILKMLKEVSQQVTVNIDIDELKSYNSTRHNVAKSIDHLLRNKGIPLKFNDYKVAIAKKLSKWVCEEIEESMKLNGTYYGNRIPKSESFPQFIEKLMKITEEMKRESKEFHVVGAKNGSR